MEIPLAINLFSEFNLVTNWYRRVFFREQVEILHTLESVTKFTLVSDNKIQSTNVSLPNLNL